MAKKLNRFRFDKAKLMLHIGMQISLFSDVKKSAWEQYYCVKFLTKSQIYVKLNNSYFFLINKDNFSITSRALAISSSL